MADRHQDARRTACTASCRRSTRQDVHADLEHDRRHRDGGIDDFGAAETFTTADATTVENWAVGKGIAEISFWNLAGRQPQVGGPFQYSHAFEPFTSSAAGPAGPAQTPDITDGATPDAATGNLRTVSCPQADVLHGHR